MTSTIKRLSLIAALVLGLSSTASAATFYVGTSCAGAPSPCTTDLQGALDASRYDTVEILANTTIVGDFVIDRQVTLQGNTGSTIATDDLYAVRVEGTSYAVVQNLTIEGRVAVYQSSYVGLLQLAISDASYGVQINDSSHVTVDGCTIASIRRGIDALDSTDVDVYDSDIDGGDYGVVASSADVYVQGTELYGDVYAGVLQDGNDSTTPSLTAVSATLTVGTSGSGKTNWVWTSAVTSYSQCSPTPTEYASSSPNLVSLIGYTPHGGD